MLAADQQLLEHSADGRELKRALIRTIRQPAPGDMQLVARFLASTDFLLRLDPAEAYEKTRAALRLDTVMRTLGESPQLESHEALVTLTRHAGFNDHVLRRKILILALAHVRPAPPEAVAYWRRHGAPDAALATTVAEATLSNATDPALVLFAQMVLHEGHPQSLRISWLRRHLLPRRDHERILRMCRFLLEQQPPQQLSPPLQQHLLDVLYDFQPQAWYKSCVHPEPPPRAAASADARALLRQIADHALTTLALRDDAQRQLLADAWERLGGADRNV